MNGTSTIVIPENLAGIPLDLPTNPAPQERARPYRDFINLTGFATII